MTDASHWGCLKLASPPISWERWGDRKTGRTYQPCRWSVSSRSGTGFMKGGETGRSHELLRSILTPGHVRAPLIMPAPLPLLSSDPVLDVPRAVLEGDWAIVGHRAWHVDESRKFAGKSELPISVLELRAALHEVKHLLRSQAAHDSRLLVLADSMVCACHCAVAKDRTSARGMLPTLRSLSSILLATGSSRSLRWIPSELNLADACSRGVRKVGYLDPSGAVCRDLPPAVPRPEIDSPASSPPAAC